LTDIAIQIIDNYIELGGPGSGNWGHAGRKGKRGGSLPRSRAMSRRTGKDWRKRQAAAKRIAAKGHTPPTDSAMHEDRLHSSLTEKDKGVIRRAVANLPQEHLDKVYGIEKRHIPGAEGRCRGNYIELNSETYGAHNRRIWHKATVVHEIGHVVQNHNSQYGDRRYVEDFGKFYREKKGRVGIHPSALRAEATKAGGPRKGFPSRYSQKDHKELFAESYQMYTSAPKTLQKRAPEIYEYMRDDVFGGVEYIK